MVMFMVGTMIIQICIHYVFMYGGYILIHVCIHMWWVHNYAYKYSQNVFHVGEKLWRGGVTVKTVKQSGFSWFWLMVPCEVPLSKVTEVSTVRKFMCVFILHRVISLCWSHFISPPRSLSLSLISIPLILNSLCN